MSTIEVGKQITVKLMNGTTAKADVILKSSVPVFLVRSELKILSTARIDFMLVPANEKICNVYKQKNPLRLMLNAHG